MAVLLCTAAQGEDCTTPGIPSLSIVHQESGTPRNQAMHILCCSVPWQEGAHATERIIQGQAWGGLCGRSWGRRWPWSRSVGKEETTEASEGTMHRVRDWSVQRPWGGALAALRTTEDTGLVRQHQGEGNIGR